MTGLEKWERAFAVVSLEIGLSGTQHYTVREFIRAQLKEAAIAPRGLATGGRDVSGPGEFFALDAHDLADIQSAIDDSKALIRGQGDFIISEDEHEYLARLEFVREKLTHAIVPECPRCGLRGEP